MLGGDCFISLSPIAMVGVADGPGELAFLKSASLGDPWYPVKLLLKVAFLLGISASPYLSNYLILAIFSASMAAWL